MGKIIHQINILCDLLYTVNDHKSHDTEPTVAMETLPMVAPVKAADTARGETSEAMSRKTTTAGETKDERGRGGGREGGAEGSTEGRTVFVSNLLFATTEKELEDKFSQVSVLTDSLVYSSVSRYM